MPACLQAVRATAMPHSDASKVRRCERLRCSRVRRSPRPPDNRRSYFTRSAGVISQTEVRHSGWAAVLGEVSLQERALEAGLTSDDRFAPSCSSRISVRPIRERPSRSMSWDECRHRVHVRERNTDSGAHAASDRQLRKSSSARTHLLIQPPCASNPGPRNQPVRTTPSGRTESGAAIRRCP